MAPRHVSSWYSVRTRSERAFTLIELLVVMIIIAILVAIAVPTFLAQKNTAMKTQVMANMVLIKQGIESCATGNTDGSYTGCSEHDPVWNFEKGLKSLEYCCPSGLKTGTYDINGIASPLTRRFTPVAGERIDGFEINSWTRDGDLIIWMQLAHLPDGTVLKKCGPGLVQPPLNTNRVGTPVPNSRLCRKGTW